MITSREVLMLGLLNDVTEPMLAVKKAHESNLRDIRQDEILSEISFHDDREEGDADLATLSKLQIAAGSIATAGGVIVEKSGVEHLGGLTTRIGLGAVAIGAFFAGYNKLTDRRYN